MRPIGVYGCLGAAVLGVASPVAAAGPGRGEGEGEAEGEAEVSVGGEGTKARFFAEDDVDPSTQPWIKRHAPRRNSWHLGLAGGVLLPSRAVDLRADSAPPFPRFTRVAGDIAMRAGWYPLRWLGLELEGTVMPGASTTAGQSVLFWTFRPQVVFQLPWWRIVPFAAIGGGALGVSSDASAVGNDVDPFVAWGGGVKLHITRNVGLRLDVRTNLSQKFAADDLADSEEILLGVVVRLGPKPKPKAEPEPTDRDGDGFFDDVDKCPDDAGIAPDGCPPGDADGDGILDPQDACPGEPGVPPDGCPPGDRDGDGFLDEVDECPDEAGVEPDGCPAKDSDADGLLDDVDKCPQKAETFNGFEDEDGCPDELPDDVKQFEGVIEGIFFDVDRDTIRPQSRPKLAEAVEVLKKHPGLRIEISGHTDSTGSREHNMDLSRRRADAVRDYLVGEGIDASRIETRGAGPDEPIDSNTTRSGRARNRRIEFRVL